MATSNYIRLYFKLITNVTKTVKPYVRVNNMSMSRTNRIYVEIKILFMIFGFDIFDIR